MTDLTLAIATSSRPSAVRRLLRSIKKYTSVPHKIILLDNTYYYDKDWNPRYGMSIDKTIKINDRLIGCCESNNILAENCDTKYIMHLDDDVYFKSDIITPLYDKIKDSNYDIVSTRWYDTDYGNYRPPIKKYSIFEDIEGKKISKVLINDGQVTLVEPDLVWMESDEALHSMIIDMNVYNKVKWDNNYVWKGDRMDFFLNCKEHGFKTAIYLADHVIHSPVKFIHKSIKNDQDKFDAKQYFKDKWNMEPQVGW